MSYCTFNTVMKTRCVAYALIFIKPINGVFKIPRYRLVYNPCRYANKAKFLNTRAKCSQ